MHLTCCKTPFQTNNRALKVVVIEKISTEAQYVSMLCIDSNAKLSEVMQRRRGRAIVLVENTHRILRAHLSSQDITILDRAKVNDA